MTKKKDEPAPTEEVKAPAPEPEVKAEPEPEVKAAEEAKTEELRTDGPTLEEWVAAGYKEENYPPAGYAKREATARVENNRNTPVIDEHGNKNWV
jgi:hypothetical protein